MNETTLFIATLLISAFLFWLYYDLVYKPQHIDHTETIRQLRAKRALYNTLTSDERNSAIGKMLYKSITWLENRAKNFERCKK